MGLVYASIARTRLILAGVRYLDIRCQVIKGELHGEVIARITPGSI